MTTEIAILNKQAIALAADSAVSSQYKIFPSANKIFTLSKYHPVGIMVYSGANFTGIPWETLIKMFRDDLGNTSFVNIDGYVNKFISFLENIEVSKDDQSAYVMRSIDYYMELIFKNIYANFNEIKDKKGEVSNQEAQSIIRQIIVRNFKQVSKADKLQIYDKISFEKFKETYKDILDKYYKDNLNNYSEFIDDLKIKFEKATYNVCLRHIFPAGYTGIVIAGFGNDDVYPHLRSFLTGGKIADQLQWAVANKSDINDRNGAEIVPFAQKDVIHLFVEGVSIDYQSMAISLFDDIMKEFRTTIINTISNKFQPKAGETTTATELESKLRNIQKELVEKVKNELDSFKWDQYIGPIVDVVTILPKSELVLLAETLVNLTTLKRKMSHDNEDVGGPTDVAIISKGDGFVWIKRKHYFKPELNHHFFSNYFRGK